MSIVCIVDRLLSNKTLITIEPARSGRRKLLMTLSITKWVCLSELKFEEMTNERADEGTGDLGD